MAFAPAVLNLSAFDAGELSALLAAAKAEVLIRLSGGRVQTGTSTGANYSVSLLSADELYRLINSLTAQLGLEADMTFARPNFSNGGATSSDCA